METAHQKIINDCTSKRTEKDSSSSIAAIHSGDGSSSSGGGNGGGGLVVVVNSESNNLLFFDMTTHEVFDKIEMGVGKWYGLCFHRPHPSSDEVLLAVSDCWTYTVRVFDMKSKRLVRSIGQGGRGSAPGQLCDPFYICLYHLTTTDARDATALIVSNRGSNRIDMFDFQSGALIRSIGEGEGRGAGQLSKPGAIAVWIPQDDPTNAQVVVADCNNHRLQFFRLSDGMYVRSVGEAGTVGGTRRRIDRPLAMSIHKTAGGRDEDALLVTVEYYTGMIHVYGMVSGEYLRCMGAGEDGISRLGLGAYGMTFYRPADEAETETQIIISDTVNHRLQVFNLYSGAHICSIGGAGDSGLFQNPQGIHLFSDKEDDSCDYVLK